MSADKNRYPHDFKRWHDIRIDEYHTAKALKDEEERKAFSAEFTAVAENIRGWNTINGPFTWRLSRISRPIL